LPERINQTPHSRSSEILTTQRWHQQRRPRRPPIPSTRAWRLWWSLVKVRFNIFPSSISIANIFLSHPRIQVHSQDPSIRKGQARHYRWQHPSSSQEWTRVLFYVRKDSSPSFRRKQRMYISLLLITLLYFPTTRHCLRGLYPAIKPLALEGTFAYGSMNRSNWELLAESSSDVLRWLCWMLVTLISFQGKLHKGLWILEIDHVCMLCIAGSITNDTSWSGTSSTMTCYFATVREDGGHAFDVFDGLFCAWIPVRMCIPSIGIWYLPLERDSRPFFILII